MTFGVPRCVIFSSVRLLSCVDIQYQYS